MEEKIKFKRKIGIKNQGIMLSIPSELKNWLKMQPGQEAIMTPEEGKYGKFIAIYIENNKEKTGEILDSNSETT